MRLSDDSDLDTDPWLFFTLFTIQALPVSAC